MTDMQKYSWVFPIVGVIFGIITFLAPVMSFNYNPIYYTWNYWIWGLAFYSFTNPDPFAPPSFSEIAFINNIPLLIVSIISSTLIIVGVVLLLIAGISSKRKIHYSKKFMKMTGVGALLLIAGAIVFYVGAGWPTTPGSSPPAPGASVWFYFQEGFSVYAPFIGGVMALLGIPVHYFIFKDRIEASIEGEKFKSKTEKLKEKLEIKKPLWVLPIIAVIFAIITFLAPVISFNAGLGYSMNWYYWIWGLTSYSVTDPYGPYGPVTISEIAFTNNISLLTISIISSIMIIVGVISLLSAGIISKRNIHYKKKFMMRTGLGAILLLVAGIIFWVGADWPTTQSSGSGPPGTSIWDYFKEGFGIYAPFIGGGIALLAMSVYYILFRFRIEGLTTREFRAEKIDKIYVLEKEINENIAKLEETQNQILGQIADLKKPEELETPPI